MFFKMILLALTCSLLDYAGPFLINLIINYITNPDRTLRNGIYLVAGIVSSRVLLNVFGARRRMLLVKGDLKVVYK